MWPLAAADLIREAGNATIWSRLHARHALVLGLLATLGYVVLLALPLIIVIADPAISTGATVAIYIAGLLADIIAGLTLLVILLRYSGRAGRGELFAVPLVTPLVDWFFRVEKT
ncbi:MAG: hypothetical protein NVSMB64_32810 [Candidatus Velthaea sp.]